VTAGAGVLLAGRSAQLMRLAARLLFGHSRRVLVTDLEWPGYVRILEEERERSGGELLCVAARAGVLEGGMAAGDLVRLVASEYRAHGCSGLFLSAVNNLGVRLPA